MSNLSWGVQFRTCGNFWTSTDFNLVDSPKILTNTKATPPLLRLRFCESQNLGENSEKIAESRLDSANQNNPSLRVSAKRAESWQSTNESKNSPSLAEGARGWVKTPSLQVLFANPSLRRESWQSTLTNHK